MTPTVSVTINPKDMARVKKSLQRFQGAPLQKRMEKGTLAAAKLLLPFAKNAAPVMKPTAGFIGPMQNWPGRLKASIKASPSRKGSGLMKGARVGPNRVPYSVPLIRGHKLVAYGHITGMSVKGNPFVDNATAPHIEEAIRVVSAELFKP